MKKVETVYDYLDKSLVIVHNLDKSVYNRNCYIMN
jgi:hypothetical protein